MTLGTSSEENIVMMNDKQQDDDSTSHHQRVIHTTMNGMKYVIGIQSNDVLFGRGAPIMNHVGNKSFRKLVSKNKDGYINSTKHSMKMNIAHTIISTIKNQLNGHFIQRKVDKLFEAQELNIPLHIAADAWIIAEEEVILQKVKQALREDYSQDSSIHTKTSTTKKRIIIEKKNVKSEEEESNHITAESSSICTSNLSSVTSINNYNYSYNKNKRFKTDSVVKNNKVILKPVASKLASQSIVTDQIMERLHPTTWGNNNSGLTTDSNKISSDYLSLLLLHQQEYSDKKIQLQQYKNQQLQNLILSNSTTSIGFQNPSVLAASSYNDSLFSTSPSMQPQTKTISENNPMISAAATDLGISYLSQQNQHQQLLLDQHKMLLLGQYQSQHIGGTNVRQEKDQTDAVLMAKLLLLNQQQQQDKSFQDLLHNRYHQQTDKNSSSNNITLHNNELLNPKHRHYYNNNSQYNNFNRENNLFNHNNMKTTLDVMNTALIQQEQRDQYIQSLLLNTFP